MKIAAIRFLCGRISQTMLHKTLCSDLFIIIYLSKSLHFGRLTGSPLQKGKALGDSAHQPVPHRTRWWHAEHNALPSRTTISLVSDPHRSHDVAFFLICSTSAIFNLSSMTACSSCRFSIACKQDKQTGAILESPLIGPFPQLLQFVTLSATFLSVSLTLMFLPRWSAHHPAILDSPPRCRLCISSSTHFLRNRISHILMLELHKKADEVNFSVAHPKYL